MLDIKTLADWMRSPNSNQVFDTAAYASARQLYFLEEKFVDLRRRQRYLELLEAYRAAVASGKTHKRWVSERRSTSRRNHVHAHGQTVPIEEYFQVGDERLFLPSDPSAPFAETANCGCTVEFFRSIEPEIERVQSLPQPPGSYNIKLSEHEGPPFGGHTLTAHVRKSHTFLKNRMVNEGLAATTSFYSIGQAETVINRALNASWARLHTWLKSPSAVKGFSIQSENLGEATGYGFTRGTKKVKVTYGVEILLIKTTSKREGFQIFDAYPLFGR